MSSIKKKNHNSLFSKLANVEKYKEKEKNTDKTSVFIILNSVSYKFISLKNAFKVVCILETKYLSSLCTGNKVLK